MKKTNLLFALVLPFFATATSYASDHTECNVPENEWMSKEEVTQKLQADGWDVKRVKEEKGCYEAYARKDGERAEIILNPKTLEILKIEEDD